jgi:UrcA family protein
MELQMGTGRNFARHALLVGAACYVAMTSALALALAPALAESVGSPGEHVTVQEDSPYTIRRQIIERRNTSLMDVQQTTVSKGVTYSDLDLSKDWDVAILKDRAKKAASDVCRVADSRSDIPFSRPINLVPDCVTSARRQALADVDRIVADARTGRTFAAK